MTAAALYLFGVVSGVVLLALCLAWDSTTTRLDHLLADLDAEHTHNQGDTA